jgi:hypothetical protein
MLVSHLKGLKRLQRLQILALDDTMQERISVRMSSHSNLGKRENQKWLKLQALVIINLRKK